MKPRQQPGGLSLGGGGDLAVETAGEAGAPFQEGVDGKDRAEKDADGRDPLVKMQPRPEPGGLQVCDGNGPASTLVAARRKDACLHRSASAGRAPVRHHHSHTGFGSRSPAPTSLC